MTATDVENAAALAAERPSVSADQPDDNEIDTAKGVLSELPASMSIDPVAERKLLWKFDLRILPTLAVMYLFNGLDKGNMGNAKTAGLEDDLHLKGNQYNILLSVSSILVSCIRRALLTLSCRSFSYPTYCQPHSWALSERNLVLLASCHA